MEKRKVVMKSCQTRMEGKLGLEVSFPRFSLYCFFSSAISARRCCAPTGTALRAFPAEVCAWMHVMVVPTRAWYDH